MCMSGLQAVYEELKNDRSEIRRLKEKRRERYASIFPGAIDYSKDKVQTSASNQMEDWMSDIDTLDKKIAALSTSLRIKQEHYTALYRLEQEPVILEHYINLTPWGRVGAKLGITRKTVYNRRRRYFEKVRKTKKYKDNERKT